MKDKRKCGGMSVQARREFVDFYNTSAQTAALRTAILCEAIRKSGYATTAKAKRIAGDRVDDAMKKLGSSLAALGLMAAAFYAGRNVKVTFGTASERRRKGDVSH